MFSPALEPADASPNVVRSADGETLPLGPVLARGPESVLYAVSGCDLAVRLYPTADAPMRHRAVERFKVSGRLPAEGLKVARAQTLLVEPDCGFVLKLPVGLRTLARTLDLRPVRQPDASARARPAGPSSGSAPGSSGLRWRLAVLEAAAETLVRLHAHGFACGAPDGTNLFVSDDPERPEVWLAPCDTLTDGSLRRLTRAPDVAAPELRATLRADSLSDAYAFSVLAWQVLSDFGPPRLASRREAAPDAEAAACDGVRRWAEAPEAHAASPVFTSELRAIFVQMLLTGREEPTARPGLATLAEALRAARELLVDCPGCAESYLGLYPRTPGAFDAPPACPWCGAARPDFVVARVFLAHQEGPRIVGERPRLALGVTRPDSSCGPPCLRDPGLPCDQVCDSHAEVTSRRVVLQLGRSHDFSARDLDAPAAPGQEHNVLSLVHKLGTARAQIEVSSLGAPSPWRLVTHDKLEVPLIRSERLAAAKLDEQVWIQRDAQGFHRAVTLKYMSAGAAR
jgi:hypothetical protein